MNAKQLQKKAVELRVEALEMIHRAGSGCSGASASVMDILVALYYGQLSRGPAMLYDPANPGWMEQDYFVLAKNSAGAALYAVLADLGFFDKSDLNGYRSISGKLGAFPHHKISGVHATVGSMGQGLSVAIGFALGLLSEKRQNRVFCLAEDRELQAGQFWEGVMAAAHYKLDRLVLFLEYSQVQADGVIRGVMNVEPIAEKFEAFGWRPFKVHDGHNFDQILNTLERSMSVTRRPVVIICKTVPGKGVPFAEGKPSYYGTYLSDPEMKAFLDYSARAWKSII